MPKAGSDAKKSYYFNYYQSSTPAFAEQLQRSKSASQTQASGLLAGVDNSAW